MKTYKIVLRLDNLNYESPVLEVEAENWEEVCEQIMGNIQIIDTEEE